MHANVAPRLTTASRNVDVREMLAYQTLIADFLVKSVSVAGRPFKDTYKHKHASAVLYSPAGELRSSQLPLTPTEIAAARAIVLYYKVQEVYSGCLGTPSLKCINYANKIDYGSKRIFHSDLIWTICNGRWVRSFNNIMDEFRLLCTDDSKPKSKPK